MKKHGGEAPPPKNFRTFDKIIFTFLKKFGGVNEHKQNLQKWYSYQLSYNNPPSRSSEAGHFPIPIPVRKSQGANDRGASKML